MKIKKIELLDKINTLEHDNSILFDEVTTLRKAVNKTDEVTNLILDKMNLKVEEEDYIGEKVVKQRLVLVERESVGSKALRELSELVSESATGIMVDMYAPELKQKRKKKVNKLQR